VESVAKAMQAILAFFGALFGGAFNDYGPGLLPTAPTTASDFTKPPADQLMKPSASALSLPNPAATNSPSGPIME